MLFHSSLPGFEEAMPPPPTVPPYSWLDGPGYGMPSRQESYRNKIAEKEKCNRTTKILMRLLKVDGTLNCNLPYSRMRILTRNQFCLSKK